MKLQDQVCTLEQAKRLKELGVIAESLFLWQYTHIDTRDGYDHTCNIVSFGYKPQSVNTELYPAFTVAELGVMMNSEYYTVRDGSEMSSFANWSWYSDANDAGFGPFNTEAQARSALLIHLLGTGKVTAEEVNQRLNA